MALKEQFTLSTTSVGRIDYSNEIALGQTRPGIALKYNQQLRVFSYVPTDIVPAPYPIPWVKPSMPSGASAHIIDNNTGIPTPFLIPKGYGLTLLEKQVDFNQDYELWVYLDGLLIQCGGALSSGNEIHSSLVIPFSTMLSDPEALSPHAVDIVMYNRGSDLMRGGMFFACLLEAIGTPPFPQEKDTMCPKCNTINHVGVHVTQVRCSSCGFDYRLLDVAAIRRL